MADEATVACRARLITDKDGTHVQCVECEASAPGQLVVAIAHTDSCPAKDPTFYSRPVEEDSYEGKRAVPSRRRKAA